jgi:LysM repeat protein
MTFENPNKIGLTREEYRDILKQLKNEKLESKIVKILEVTTQWIKGKLRKIVVAAVILANGLFAAQTFACDEYTVRAGDTWSKLSARTGFTVEYLQQINGKKTPLLKAGETVILPNMEEYMADAAEHGPAVASILANHSLPLNEHHPQPELKKETGQSKQIHVVQKGDNLWKIARHYATTTEILMEKNGLASTLLKPGQTLVVPDKIQSGQMRTEVSGSSHFQQTYTVQKGDNLWRIARTHQTTVEAIMKDNALPSTKLKENQKLIIKHQNIKTATARMDDIGDPTTIYLTNTEGKELILQIPYGKEEEFQRLRGKNIKVTYIEHHESTGKLVQYQ